MLQRRALVTLAVVLGTLAIGVAVAGAHIFRADSEVTIRHNDAKEQFQGRVLSDRRSCIRNREVVVVERKPGRNTVVGADQTNDVGFWKVEKRNPNGRFFARVLRRARGSGDHLHVCRADRSETIRVGRTVPTGRAQA